MSTYRKNITNKTKPISKYRYPHKFGLTLDVKNDGWVRKTIEISEETYDLNYYDGDRKTEEFNDLWELVSIGIGNGSLVHSWIKSIDDEFGRDLPKHFTVIFNSCELWGNNETVPYVEVFPSYQWDYKRSERDSIYCYFDCEENAFQYIGRIGADQCREPKSHTPSLFVKKVRTDFQNKTDHSTILGEVSTEVLLSELQRRTKETVQY